MNKKQAVAYAQVTLNFMQSLQYNGEINPETLGIEMNEAFKIYSKDIIVDIANTQIAVDKEFKNMK